MAWQRPQGCKCWWDKKREASKDASLLRLSLSPNGVDKLAAVDKDLSAFGIRENLKQMDGDRTFYRFSMSDIDAQAVFCSPDSGIGDREVRFRFPDGNAQQLSVFPA